MSEQVFKSKCCNADVEFSYGGAGQSVCEACDKYCTVIEEEEDIDKDLSTKYFNSF